jgi:hypothetical protein
MTIRIKPPNADDIWWRRGNSRLRAKARENDIWALHLAMFHWRWHVTHGGTTMNELRIIHDALHSPNSWNWDAGKTRINIGSETLVLLTGVRDVGWSAFARGGLDEMRRVRRDSARNFPDHEMPKPLWNKIGNVIEGEWRYPQGSRDEALRLHFPA